MKKKPAKRWSAKARPVEEAGRDLLASIEAQGDKALERAFLRLAFGERDELDKDLISLGAVEVLQFVRAAGRRSVDVELARRIAERLRQVLNGSTWNEAFDAPWAMDIAKANRLAVRDWRLAEAFNAKLKAIRTKRPGATLEEVRESVAKDEHVSVGTLRAALAWRASLAKKATEKK